MTWVNDSVTPVLSADITLRSVTVPGLVEGGGGVLVPPIPAVTVIVPDPLLPLRDAVISAVPSLTPVTSPVGETVATVESPEVQVM